MTYICTGPEDAPHLGSLRRLAPSTTRLALRPEPPSVHNRGTAVREKRKKIWIDPFQTYLSVRIAVYFILYQAAVWSLFAIERSMLSALEETVGPAGVALGFFFLVLCVLVLGLLFIVLITCAREGVAGLVAQLWCRFERGRR